jgi:hypothetical protein
MRDARETRRSSRRFQRNKGEPVPTVRIPCILESAAQDRSEQGRGRSRIPGSQETVREQESPRPHQRRSKVRTVAGRGRGPAQIAQGGTRSASVEGKVEQPGVFVGVDVWKAKLDVAIRPGGEFFSELNDQRSVRRLVNRLKSLGCTRIVLEATGGYETLLAAALAAEGLPVVVVNPRWARDFARSIGQLAKTDHLDARLLAQFAEVAELQVRELPDEQTRELQGSGRMAGGSHRNAGSGAASARACAQSAASRDQRSHRLPAQTY